MSDEGWGEDAWTESSWSDRDGYGVAEISDGTRTVYVPWGPADEYELSTPSEARAEALRRWHAGKEGDAA